MRTMVGIRILVNSTHRINSNSYVELFTSIYRSIYGPVTRVIPQLPKVGRDSLGIGILSNLDRLTHGGVRGIVWGLFVKVVASSTT